VGVRAADQSDRDCARGWRLSVPNVTCTCDCYLPQITPCITSLCWTTRLCVCGPHCCSSSRLAITSIFRELILK
jgi:hypothetical protein